MKKELSEEELLAKKKKEEERARLRQEIIEEEALYKKRDAHYKEVNAYQKKFLSSEKEESVPTSFLSCRDISKIYSNRVEAVSHFNIDIEKGEFIVFVGPSGCGKSTILRMIAGLEDISGGALYINGVLCNKLEPKDRAVAMVFQSYALYPHLSVYENMAFGLRGMKVKEKELDENGNPKLDENGKPIFIKRKLTKEEIDKRIKDASEMLQITEYLRRKPTQLSGGQCQRVALGRAIVRKAEVFLLDEPLSNLDAKLRVIMRTELTALHREIKNTTIYVTHDQTEAMTMADRIVVLRLGHVQQIGTPQEVYDHPANLFVATFMGSPTMNILEGQYHEGKILFEDGKTLPLDKEQIEAHDKYYAETIKALKERIALDEEKILEKQNGTYAEAPFPHEEDKEEAMKELAEAEKAAKGEAHNVSVGIRPQDIVFTKTGKGFPVDIILSELLGAEYSIHFELGGKEITALVPSKTIIKAGEKGNIELKKEKIHLFDGVSKKTIF